jgi:hypothetical protein
VLWWPLCVPRWVAMSRTPWRLGNRMSPLLAPRAARSVQRVQRTKIAVENRRSVGPFQGVPPDESRDGCCRWAFRVHPVLPKRGHWARGSQEQAKFDTDSRCLHMGWEGSAGTAVEASQHPAASRARCLSCGVLCVWTGEGRRSPPRVKRA